MIVAAAGRIGAPVLRTPAVLVRVLIVTLVMPAVVIGRDAPADQARVMSGEVFAAVNEARARAGMAALQLEPALQRAAERYAARMATSGRFDHRDLGGADLGARAPEAGYSGWVYLGENLARGRGSTSGSDIVGRFLASETHRANVLSAEATDAGIGCVVVRSESWCVQLVGGRAR